MLQTCILSRNTTCLQPVVPGFPAKPGFLLHARRIMLDEVPRGTGEAVSRRLDDAARALGAPRTLHITKPETFALPCWT